MGKKLLCSLLVANPVAGWLLRHLLNYCYTRKAVNWFYRKMGLLEHAYGKAAQGQFAGHYFVDAEVTLPAGRGTVTFGIFQDGTLVGTRIAQLQAQPATFPVKNLTLSSKSPNGHFEAQIFADDTGSIHSDSHPLGTADVQLENNKPRRYPIYSSAQVNYENTFGLKRSDGLLYCFEGKAVSPQRLLIYCGDSIISQDTVNSAHTAIGPILATSQDLLILCVQNPLFYQQDSAYQVERVKVRLKKLVRKVMRRYKLSAHQTTVVGINHSSDLAVDIAKALPGAALLTTSPLSGAGYSSAELIGRTGAGISKLHLFCSNDDSIVEAARQIQDQGLSQTVHLYRFDETTNVSRKAHNQTIHSLLCWEKPSLPPLQQWVRYQSEGQELLHVRFMPMAAEEQPLPALWIEEKIDDVQVHIYLDKHPNVPNLYYLKQPAPEGLYRFAGSHTSGAIRSSPSPSL
ncbi:hypothetical protein [Rothia nasimurium]|uniref:hypothetical protein n=1 Tax=Rothia nasimurium TaxID=85336 RepID=UPI001F292018|nr:hypothetical protein [Rothia nasimurium]